MTSLEQKHKGQGVLGPCNEARSMECPYCTTRGLAGFWKTFCSNASCPSSLVLRKLWRIVPCRPKISVSFLFWLFWTEQRSFEEGCFHVAVRRFVSVREVWSFWE